MGHLRHLRHLQGYGYAWIRRGASGYLLYAIDVAQKKPVSGLFTRTIPFVDSSSMQVAALGRVNISFISGRVWSRRRRPRPNYWAVT